MHWRDLPLNPDRRTLRQFAMIWIAFFAGFALVEQRMHHRPALAAVLALLAVTIGPLGVVKPQAIKRIFVTWSVLAFPIGWVVSWVALCALFYGVFTPIAFAFRLAGRDALVRRKPSGRQTYWKARSAPAEISSYLRQA